MRIVPLELYCPKCHKRFIRLAGLNKHIRTCRGDLHEGQIPIEASGIVESMAALSEVAHPYFDSVDVEAYMRELRED